MYQIRIANPTNTGLSNGIWNRAMPFCLIYGPFMARVAESAHDSHARFPFGLWAMTPAMWNGPDAHPRPTPAMA